MTDTATATAGPQAADAAPVFISYASQDAPVAHRVCAALEAGGVRCWIAPRDVRAGESYAAAIVQAINSCRMLLLLLSRSAVDSTHVLREVERASSKRRPILSVRLDDAALPPELEYFLSVNHWLDATREPLERVLPAILAAAAPGAAAAAVAPPAVAAAVAPPTAAGRAPAPPRRRWLAAAAIVLAVLAVGAGRWLLTRPAHGPHPGATAQAEAGTNSVAVLPFADLSEKKDQQYFADGLTEELIDRLARVPGLHVPARASAFYFRGRQATLTEIAAALNVTHVLEGSVRKAGDEVRISVELVRVADESRVWSETFDRRIDDIFKAQDAIAGAVVQALEGSLMKGGAPGGNPARVDAQAAPAPTVNGEAYTTYLQGRAILRGGTVEDFRKAIDYFQRAVALDPNLAVAWAAIANATADGYGTEHFENREVASPRAHAAVERALALDPAAASTYVALARVAHFIDLDWETTRNALKRALELDSGNAEALRLSSYLAGTLGELEAQRRYAAEAIAHDPLDHWNYFAAGLGAYSRGSFAEAEQLYRKAIELNDRADGPHSELARLLVARGEAAAALEEARREPSPAWRALRLPIALDALGRRGEADAALAAAQARYGGTYPVMIAQIYAARGDRDRAFEWLDRAVAQRDLPPIYLRYDPLMKSLVDDPRYAAFLRKAKLPP